MLRRSIFPCAALLAIAACSLSTEPRPDFDASRYPYAVTSGGTRVFGTSRVLVILARFSDGAPIPITSGDIKAQLFGSTNGGPVNEAFALASGGAFKLGGDVTSWVTTNVAVADLFRAGVLTPTGIEDYVWQALGLVDAQMDYGRFDNDGPDGFANSGDDDGVVDGGVVLLNSELNRYCNGGTGRGPHPFASLHWTVDGARYRTLDVSARGGVIEVGGYTVMAANGCGGTNVGAHVLTHELGHLMLGLPDLYHPVGGTGEVFATRRWVVGCWELMAAGSWGCGTGAPTLDYRFNSLGAWARMTVGWVTPRLVDTTKDSTYDLDPPGRGGTVLRVPVKAGEYLLVEYREGGKGDRRLPANGVLMYYVADSLSPFPSVSRGPYRVSLIEADDDSAMFRPEILGGNRGTAADAFGTTRTTFRTGEHTRAKALDGTPLPFAISAISINPSTHRARLRISPVALASRR